MTWLIAGIAVFFGVHFIPSRPPLRRRLVQAIGELPYKGAFALLSLTGLVLMAGGMGRMPYIALWHPPSSAATATAIFMAPALILLAASAFKGNIKRIVRHPMSLGVLLWSLSHLLANGDLAALLFFGSFALYALYDLRTANAPPAAPEKPDSMTPDLLAGAIGLAAYFLLIAFHGTLFGAAIF